MKVKCVWEHNGEDSLLHAADYPGAYTRGKTGTEAAVKMEQEVRSYLKWKGESIPAAVVVEIVQEVPSELEIRDADSDVLFDTEWEPLTLEEYTQLKNLALKSAEDFLCLYHQIPDPSRGCDPVRRTFYGTVPRTAEEMYLHTKNVNAYYFGEIGVDADNEGDILECRRRGFTALEARPDFLRNPVFDGSYGEQWTLRKVLRRFIWHDRIHAKAMYRMALRLFGENVVPNIFQFE